MHKLTRINSSDLNKQYCKCGKVAKYYFEADYFWKSVTCKKCLKYKELKEIRRRLKNGKRN